MGSKIKSSHRHLLSETCTKFGRNSSGVRLLIVRAFHTVLAKITGWESLRNVACLEFFGESYIVARPCGMRLGCGLCCCILV